MRQFWSERAYKRSGLPYKTLVLLEMGKETESKEIAHYVWVTEVAPKKKRVRILKKRDSEPGVLIEAVDKKSPAERCGFKPGDIILKVDDRDIYELFDMHLVFAKGEDKKSYRINNNRTGRGQKRGDFEKMTIELTQYKPFGL